jgi:hypothetical protein
MMPSSSMNGEDKPLERRPSCACACVEFSCTLDFSPRRDPGGRPNSDQQGAPRLSSQNGPRYTPEQGERLLKIHERLVEARRELDALIGDAYLRPRANVVPVHFLDLASAVEKLRWAEKEWRELDREREATNTHGDGLVEVAP